MDRTADRARTATFGAATFIDPSGRCSCAAEASTVTVNPETSLPPARTEARRVGLLQGVRRCFGIDEEEVPELMARQSDRIEQLRDLVRETQEMHEVALAQVYSEEVEPLRRKLKESDLAAHVQDEEMLTLHHAAAQSAEQHIAGANHASLNEARNESHSEATRGAGALPIVWGVAQAPGARLITAA